MIEFPKGRSPFYPGQPVPVELFVGRAEQIQRIQTRGAGQVAQGKPVSVFIQGEYGIGKSSIAGFAQWLAEKENGLHGIYATLGGAKDLTDVAYSVLQATMRSGAFDPSRSERIRNWLAKYIGKQELFGFSLNLELLRKDAPNLSTPFGMLGFLSEALDRLKETSAKGVFLVLDEINGIATQADFAHFVKGLVDANAMSRTPLPLLLMLCGVEERRRDMIRRHQPIDRIFDIIEIEAMDEREMQEFFARAFESVQIRVATEAMSVLTEYSAGFPKIMHLVGDAAFWTDDDGMIDKVDAFDAVFQAAEEVGRKYVDQQVYRALRSKDYHSILSKLAKAAPPASPCFQKDHISTNLTETEKKKLSNFLQKMKSLKVLRSGEVRGQYVFNSRMVQLYIWLQSRRGTPPNSAKK
jgi:hypothetical protein